MLKSARWLKEAGRRTPGLTDGASNLPDRVARKPRPAWPRE